MFVAHNKRKDVFAALLSAVCEVLQTDRYFLRLRNPYTRMYQNRWRRSPQIPDTSTNSWQPEIEWERKDPMFAAALRTDSSIFVEDVEKSSSYSTSGCYSRTQTVSKVRTGKGYE